MYQLIHVIINNIFSMWYCSSLVRVIISVKYFNYNPFANIKLS